MLYRYSEKALYFCVCSDGRTFGSDPCEKWSSLISSTSTRASCLDRAETRPCRLMLLLTYAGSFASEAPPRAGLCCFQVMLVTLVV